MFSPVILLLFCLFRVFFVYLKSFLFYLCLCAGFTKYIIVIVLLFAQLLRRIWLNLYSLDFFWKFLVTIPSAVMTKGNTDRFLIFQTFFISRAKFSYFVIFSLSILGRKRIKGTAISVKSAVLFSV